MTQNEHPLEFLFHPRSIAVVGASTTQGPGSGFMAAIKEMGFDGDLYPVNPKVDELQGMKCYPRLAEVPGAVDYVISCVPVAVVPQMIEEAAEKGVKAIRSSRAGVRGTGEAERWRRESRVRARAGELGIRVIGPNCMGLCCPAAGLSFMPGLPTEPGPVGMVSQSGANAADVCRTGGARGLRYSKVISYGNAADLTESDFLDYLAEDPETKLIAGYIEGVKDGQRFLRTLAKAAAAKPVIILKGGRTEAGSRATVSHTGSLAGEMQVFDAVCRQAGAMRVESIEELIDTAAAFRFLGRLDGPRVGIVGIGGGNSVLAADDVAAAGLEVPPLPEETQRQLAEFTPVAGTSVRNPVDTNVGFGPDGPRLMRETLRLVAEAPNIDVILYQAAIGWGPSRGAEGPSVVEIAKQIATSTGEAVREFGKPIVVLVRPPLTTEVMEASITFMEEAATQGLAIFPAVSNAARALRRLLDYQIERQKA